MWVWFFTRQYARCYELHGGSQCLLVIIFYMSTGTRLVPRKTGVFLHLWHVLMLTLSEVKAGLEKRFQGLQVPDGPDFRGREKMKPVGCTNLDSWRVSADMEQNPSRNGREDNWPVSNQTRPDRKHGFVMPCDTRFFKSRSKPEDLSNFQSYNSGMRYTACSSLVRWDLLCWTISKFIILAW